VQYLISKGIADPHRICIYGASYGGYAALWGMVKTPELYRCGVSFAGVSDIGKHLTGSSDANDSKLGREYMRFAIGDAKLNQAQFDAVSPLKHADRIQAPILLMHGDRDQRVPLSSGSDMDDVLTKLGKPHEWYVFEGEGHGLYYLDSEKVYYKKLLAFLKKYIGPEAGAPAKKE
jgi:dipeptidyl aminopeptidase/acylaminoacyl peptidase